MLPSLSPTTKRSLRNHGAFDRRVISFGGLESESRSVSGSRVAFRCCNYIDSSAAPLDLPRPLSSSSLYVVIAVAAESQRRIWRACGSTEVALRLTMPLQLTRTDDQVKSTLSDPVDRVATATAEALEPRRTSSDDRRFRSTDVISDPSPRRVRAPLRRGQRFFSNDRGRYLELFSTYRRSRSRSQAAKDKRPGSDDER